MIKPKNFLILVVSLISFLLLLNSACLRSEQKGYLTKMKNGETITLGLNKTAVIKNIWKDKVSTDWNIKLKLLSLDRESIKIRLSSPTFLGSDYVETKSIKANDVISIIQAEEVITKIKLVEIIEESAIISIKIIVAPPAPELAENFDVEIN